MPSNFRANPNLDKISITSCCDAQYGKFFFFQLDCTFPGNKIMHKTSSYISIF